MPAFEGCILPVDLAVARRCRAFQVPNPINNQDALIAATASVHGFTVVTRNVSHFKDTGVLRLNPWQD
jgi:predicted nucleic acid-binding protein